MNVDDSGAETMTNVLPDEILLSIFRFLEYEDIISAEQVCWQWKTVCETCFTTEKRLSLFFLHENYSYSLKRMKRYGSSVQTLIFGWHEESDYAKLNWVEEIADRFPNLITIDLCYIQISDGGFKCLSTKCPQLKNVALRGCSFTNEGLRIFLQALPGIKVLKFYKINFKPGLPIQDSLPQADASAVLSNCRNLQSFGMSGTNFGCSDTASASRFFKECITLRTLRIRCSVTDETLVELSKCVSLGQVTLTYCPLVSDRGCAALLARCPLLVLLNVCGCKGVSNVTVDSAIEAVECRLNGLVLHLKHGDTSVTPQKYENCHPLLNLCYD